MSFDSIQRKLLSMLGKVVFSIVGFFALFSRPHIKIPKFLNDKKLILMASYFTKEKWVMLESNLKQLKEQERVVFFQGIATKGAHAEKFNNWVNVRKGNDLSLLAMAHHHIAKGWEYRGRGFATLISNKSWELFYQELGKAVAAITIVKNNEKYAIDSAMCFLNMSQTSILSEQEQQWAYNLLQEKGQHIVLAHLDVLNSLTPKWGGSVEQMNSYIEKQKNNINVHTALIASKHIEMWMDKDSEIEEGFPNPYFKNQNHLEEISKVFTQYTHSFEDPNLIDFIILNYYTAVFYLAKEHNFASQCIANLEGKFTEHPWRYLGDSFLEIYDTNRVISRIAKELKR